LSVSTDIPYERILKYLNRKTGRKFETIGKRSDNSRKFIKARWNQGFVADDFKKVIDNMFEKWGGDPKMSEYLRPSTLFGPKFSEYLQDPCLGISRKNEPPRIEAQRLYREGRKDEFQDFCLKHNLCVDEVLT